MRPIIATKAPLATFSLRLFSMNGSSLSALTVSIMLSFVSLGRTDAFLPALFFFVFLDIEDVSPRVPELPECTSASSEGLPTRSHVKSPSTSRASSWFPLIKYGSPSSSDVKNLVIRPVATKASAKAASTAGKYIKGARMIYLTSSWDILTW